MWQYEWIQKKICRQKMSIMFNEICINEEMLPKYTYALYIYIYIYIYIYSLEVTFLTSLSPFVCKQMILSIAI